MFGRTFAVGSLLVGVLLIACGGKDDQPRDLSGTTRPVVTPGATSALPAGGVTAGPTQTPVRATPTVRAILVPAGWKRFEADEFQIWLPGSYEGGSPTSADFDLVIDGLRSLGRDDLVALAEAGRSTFVLFMLDTDPVNLGANVNVVLVSVPESVSLEAVVDQAIRAYPEGVSVLDRATVTLGSRAAVRVLADLAIGDINAGSVQYFLRQGTSVWVVTYSHVHPDFERAQATFEESAATIRFLR